MSKSPLSVTGRALQMLSRVMLLMMVTSLAALTPNLSAQATQEAKGSIRGRIFDVPTQRYVPDAIVTVAGTTVRVVTDEIGNYYLPDLVAGEVKVHVSYPNRDAIDTSITVLAGQEVTQDLSLGSPDAKKSDVVILEPFQVNTNRFNSAEAIALASERASVNLKDVVAVEALGMVPGQSVGQMLQFLPGMDVSMGASGAFQSGMGINPSAVTAVGTNGFDSEETEIWIDGMPVAGGVSPSKLSRTVGLDLITLNDIARVEIIKTPPLESLNNKLGYVINLITRSSLETAKPSYQVGVGIEFNTMDGYNFFERKPGPANHPTYHTVPNFDFNATVPIKRNLGFNVGLSWNRSYSPNYQTNTKWQTAQVYYKTYTLTAGATGTTTPVRLPDNYNPAWYTSSSYTANTTAATYGQQYHYYNVGNATYTGKSYTGTAADAMVGPHNPYFKETQDLQQPFMTTTWSLNLGVNWRPWPWLDVRPSFSYNETESINAKRNLVVTAGYPTAWDEHNAYGQAYLPAAGGLPEMTAGSPKIEEKIDTRDRKGITKTFQLNSQLNKDGWKGIFQASYSQTEATDLDTSLGHFASVEASTPTLGKIDFLGIDPKGFPTKINAYKRDGTTFEYQKLANWSELSGDAALLGKVSDGKYTNRTTTALNLNVTKTLDFLPVPVSIGLVGKYTKVEAARGGPGSNSAYQYIGLRDNNGDGVVDAPKLTLKDYIDSNFMREPGKGAGYAFNQEWVDTYKMYDYMKAHPEWWTFGPETSLNRGDAARNTNNYRETINTLMESTETTKAVGLTLQTALFNNRLTLGTGINISERTTEGRGKETFGKWNYIIDSNKLIYKDLYYPQGIRIDGAATKYDPTGTGATGALQNVLVTMDTLRESGLASRLAQQGAIVPNHIMEPDANFWYETTGFKGYYSDYKAQTGVTLAATTANSMEAAKRNAYTSYTESTKREDPQPKFQARYALFDWVTLRGAWSRGVQLPTLSNGNASSGLVGYYKITEKDDGSGGSIEAANADLKSKKTDNFTVAVDLDAIPGHGDWLRITADTSLIKIKNDWVTTTLVGGSGQEYLDVLATLGLDPNYYDRDGWSIKTTANAESGGSSKGNTWKFGANGNLGWLGSAMSRFSWQLNYNYSKTENKNNVANAYGLIAATTKERLTWNIRFQYWRFSTAIIGAWDSDYTEKSGTFKFDFDNNGIADTIQTYKFVPARWTLKWMLNFMTTKRSQLQLTLTGLEGAPKPSQVKDTLGIMPEYSTYSGVQEWGTTVSLRYTMQF